MNALHQILVDEAAAEGFPLAAGVDTAVALAAGGAYAEHVSRYDRWLGSGFAGEMGYLARGRDRRADPTAVFPGLKSVFCVALPYSAASAGAADSFQGPRYARYLRGHDYHRVIAEKLERVLDRAAARWLAENGRALKWKICVDTSAVLERSWAALAGLGWIGKNTMLIHPRFGSYTLLGEALLDQELDAGPRPLPDYCGHCRRCLDACPTSAFISPRELDSRRCISYLTLERRTPFGPEDPPTAPWVAGCDVCQEVCPFNHKAAKAAGDGEVDPTLVSDWESLNQETDENYRSRVAQSALKRVKPEQFRRNLEAARRNQPATNSPNRKP